MSKSKRKLLISMLVAMFVLLSAVAIVAIAFALTQQTITTTLNIGYTVTDLDGSVYATYTVGGITTHLNPNPVGGTVNGHSLVFSASDTQDAGTLDFPSNIDLSSTNDNIVIQYTYANTGDKHYIASMSFASNVTTDNMNVEYGIWDSSTNSVKYSTDRYAVVVPSGATEKSYWIKISITNKAKSASFSGDFRWNLSGYDKTDVAYPSLTSLEFTENSSGDYSVSIASEKDYIGEIVFPSSVNGESVTIISASETLTDTQKATVRSVYIPDSVTLIDTYAFQGYTNLQTVTFEQNKTTTSSVKAQSSTGLQTIGQYAFYLCEKLVNIDIPATASIDCGAFACTGLTSITVYNTSTECFWGCSKLTSVTIMCRTIDYAAFGWCTSLTSITIPSGVTQIEQNAFQGCTNLTSVTFENTTGWTVGGTSIDVTNPATNATNLTSTYCDYAWDHS